jgi:hypothetical protein
MSVTHHRQNPLECIGTMYVMLLQELLGKAIPVGRIRQNIQCHRIVNHKLLFNKFHVSP